MMGDREAGQQPAPEATARRPAVIALSRVEFAHAVKRALRDLHHPDALARNPLSAGRLVLDHPTATSPTEILGDALRAAIESLGGHPRDLRLQRVLDRTFVRPAATQEMAAELLDLPMSTYRRHLVQGTERVIDWMWQREVDGWPAG
jgi:hypothetical protein